jgi:hypothetical protein
MGGSDGFSVGFSGTLLLLLLLLQDTNSDALSLGGTVAVKRGRGKNDLAKEGLGNK